MYLASVLEVATPLVLAALGCLLTVRAGMDNIGIEGMMLGGAFAGAAVSTTIFGPWGGLAVAALAGLALALLLAWSHLSLGADFVLAGIAVNLLAAGGTATFLFAINKSKDKGANALESNPLPTVHLSFLDGVPVLKALAALSPITWATLVLAPVVVYLYFHSRPGIWIRAVGGNAPAVVEAGISPTRVKWLAMSISGVFAGLAGAQLSLATTHTFVRDMTQGRGFIALAAVYLGLKHPIGTIIAATAFGMCQALTILLQARTSIPTDPLTAFPYVVTVLALGIAGLRSLRRPSATVA
ncbi:ABC transporter permease [Kribbella solani]|uniref:Simple sugar transport system permease protein n=1 Tax=Kribbella solani TaxID=236067 RepID=A0A841DE90_9ACTN|nr:ABC transporter permease [Kribbella solani]MBB5977394.1 simple sugar transport system permease protein [Kribbella solani]